jgi:hypothetical protein
MEDELVSTNVGTYETMYECFSNREQLAITAGGKDGHYPTDMQGICVKRNDK